MNNVLAEFICTKKPKFGHYVGEFATPGIGHLLASAGCDFVFFDMEHSPKWSGGLNIKIPVISGWSINSSSNYVCTLLLNLDSLDRDSMGPLGQEQAAVAQS